MSEKVKAYIAEALRRNHPVDTIVGKLVSIGHEKEQATTLVKHAVQQRIHTLEQAPAEISAGKTITGIVFSFLMRGAIGAIAAWSLYHVIVA